MRASPYYGNNNYTKGCDCIVPDESGHKLFGQIDRAFPIQVFQERNRRQQSAHEYERIRVQTRRARNDRPWFSQMLKNIGHKGNYTFKCIHMLFS